MRWFTKKQHPISHDMLVELFRHTGYMTYRQSVNVASLVAVMLEGGTLDEARAKFDADEADDEAFKREMSDQPESQKP